MVRTTQLFPFSCFFSFFFLFSVYYYSTPKKKGLEIKEERNKNKKKYDLIKKAKKKKQEGKIKEGKKYIIVIERKVSIMIFSLSFIKILSIIFF